MSDIKTGDVVELFDPATDPASVVILSVAGQQITGQPDPEPIVFRLRRAVKVPPIEQPKQRPEIVSRPGRPTRWR